MNKKRYYELILSLRTEYRKKRPQKQRIGNMPLLQGNAPPHRAGLTQATIREYGFELLPHPAYSPDLAPSSVFSVPRDEKRVEGQAFCGHRGHYQDDH